MESIKKYVAEFIGTFVLVFVACGVAVATSCSAVLKTSAEVSYLATALAFGLVIVAMAYSIGNVSGCHINPAVSIAMLTLGKMSLKDFAGYVVAQFLGATAGAAAMIPFYGKDCGFGSNSLAEGVSAGQGFAIEAILTCVFVMAIIGVTSKKESSDKAGLVIGLALTLVHLLGIPFTGTSVNPARSFGPAIFAGGAALSNLWIFILAPLVGGVVAAVVYNFLAPEKKARHNKK